MENQNERSAWFRPVSIKKNIKQDLLSGFIVSLIALPLCLGVAAASNFPPITGVLTSIIAGLVVAFFSGSELAVKGPAAGLIVIVAGAVEEYGRGNMQQGYLLTASLIALTGVIQIILGVLKVGKWADFIPSSVVHGMLAAIGIIIISKQIHFMVGVDPAEIKGLEPVELIRRIPKSLMNLEWHISLVGIVSLLLLILLPRVKTPFIRTIPPFLIVIIVSVLIVQLFHLASDTITFHSSLLDPGKLALSFNFSSGIFDGDNLGISAKYFFLLSIIGTIESILTVKAVDLLDPYKRNSNYNKDIIAIGIGNLLAGLMGALPMISEVARSSANINSKAITRISSIAHGAFLVIFVLVFVSLIKLIPVAALSSILIFVGYKLANPRSFFLAYKISNEHLFVFLATAVVTVSVDLLAGVVAGIILKTLINFARGGEFKRMFAPKIATLTGNGQLTVTLDKVAVFTNWLSLKKIILGQQAKKVVVDFAAVKLVDTAFIDNINRYKETCTHELIIKSFQELRPLKNHPHSMRLRATGDNVFTVSLTRHQQRLKAFAAENDFIISFSSIIPKSYFAAFKGFKHTDVKLTHVFISGQMAGVKFGYFECMVYDSVDMIEYYLNVMEFENKHKVPRFMMQKESGLEAMVDFFVRSQSILPGKDAFNAKYSIYTREPVENIFTEQVVNFFEGYEMKDEVIEGDGISKVIIYNSGSNRGINSLVRKLELLAGLNGVAYTEALAQND